MRAFLIVLIVLNALASFLIFSNAKSAIHEILAAVTFLTAAVLLGAQAVMGSVADAQRDIGDRMDALRRLLEERGATAPPPAARREVAMPPPAPPVPRGACTNCHAVIPLTSKSCPRCKADFGPHSAFKVKPL